MEDDILQMFLEDTREHLADIESDLLDIEEAGADFDPELVNKVFRTAHSIKGSAGFLALNNIRDLSHKIENVLDLVRGRELAPTTEVVSIVLKSFDMLETMVENVHESDAMDISGHVATLTALVTHSLPPEQQPMVTAARALGTPDNPTLFRITEHEFLQAKKGGNFIYLVEYDLLHDVHRKNKTPLDLMRFLEKSGLILDCKLDISAVGDLENEPTNRIPFFILYASILEPDLVKAIFQVEARFIHAIDSYGDALTDPSPPPAAAPAARAPISDDDIEAMARQFDQALSSLSLPENPNVSATFDGAAKDHLLARDTARVESRAAEKTVEGYLLRSQDGVASLAIDGDMTVDHGQALKTALLHALDRHAEVRIDLSAVEAIDLAGLQIIWSAYISGRNKGVTVSCLGASQVVSQQARRAGFTRETAIQYGMVELGMLAE